MGQDLNIGTPELGKPKEKTKLQELKEKSKDKKDLLNLIREGIKQKIQTKRDDGDGPIKPR
jgi:hypothetical protein